MFEKSPRCLTSTPEHAIVGGLSWALMKEECTMESENLNHFYSNKVKRLPPSVVKDIELKNQARKLANLAPIRIRIRACIACNQMFESAGNRTCGCNTRSTGYIAGS